MFQRVASTARIIEYERTVIRPRAYASRLLRSASALSAMSATAGRVNMRNRTRLLLVEDEVPGRPVQCCNQVAAINSWQLLPWRSVSPMNSAGDRPANWQLLRRQHGGVASPLVLIGCWLFRPRVAQPSINSARPPAEQPLAAGSKPTPDVARLACLRA